MRTLITGDMAKLQRRFATYAGGIEGNLSHIIINIIMSHVGG